MITVFLGADRMKDFDIIFEQLSINWSNTIAYTIDKKKNIKREYETHYESRILYLQYSYKNSIASPSPK